VNLDANLFENLAAKCGFVRAEHWGKSSVALVVDVGGKKLVAHQRSD
jgi:hypothetical protein